MFWSFFSNRNFKKMARSRKHVCILRMPSSMSQATCTWLIHNFMLFGLEREKNDGNIVRKEACRTKLPFDAGPTLGECPVSAGISVFVNGRAKPAYIRIDRVQV